MLEEVYLYFDMPAPAFGVQLVYTESRAARDRRDRARRRRRVMPQGYHPNVAAPGGRINFIWMMAAHREGDDRQFGVVNVQPGFARTAPGSSRRAQIAR